MRHLLVGFVFASVLVTTSSAAGDPWGVGPPDAGEHPDGGLHTYCYASTLATGAEANIYYAEVESMDNSTNADRDYDSPCDVSGSPQTDVRWLTGNLAPGVRGSTTCAAFQSGNCDRNNVTLDLAELNFDSDDEADQTKTACHELGHTMGLTHGGASEDCMVSGERPGPSHDWDHYGTHHTYHINQWF